MQLIWAYIGLYWGIFISGEFVFTAAVVASRQGHFDFWGVILIGLLATWLPDVLTYEVGRRNGTKWLSEKQLKSPRLQKASDLLREKENTLLFSYRFIYGFRTAILLIIGSQFGNYRKFILFSLLAGCTWIAVYASVGLLFGSAISKFWQDIRGAEFYIIGALLGITLLFGFVKYVIRREV